MNKAEVEGYGGISSCDYSECCRFVEKAYQQGREDQRNDYIDDMNRMCINIYCEWTTLKGMFQEYEYPKNHKDCSPVVFRAKDNHEGIEYCAVCGRKIKVV